jgi:signal peptidase I
VSIEDDPVLREAARGARPITADVDPELEERTKPSGARNVAEWVLIAGGALLVAFIIKTFLLQAFYIPSLSMAPTLKVNDRVLVNKLSYDLHDVHRGDLVVFESPPNEGSQTKDLIKRVIGLPGETVESREGQIYINGQVLEEPYLGPDVTTGPLEKVTVPPEHLWVMGDNRPNSRDSRFFGAIPESLVIGRAFMRVWPVTAISLL